MNTDINSATLIIALICFGAGIILGGLLTRVFSGPVRQKRQVSEQLRQNMETSATYRYEVAEHFVKTSGLLNNLTASYVELNRHLAASAEKLASPEISRQLAEVSSIQSGLILPTNHEGQAQAPRDYAPGNGVLSADYGLGRTNSVNQGNPTNDANFDPGREQTEDDPTLKVV